MWMLLVACGAVAPEQVVGEAESVAIVEVDLTPVCEDIDSGAYVAPFASSVFMLEAFYAYEDTGTAGDWAPVEYRWVDGQFVIMGLACSYDGLRARYVEVR